MLYRDYLKGRCNSFFRSPVQLGIALDSFFDRYFGEPWTNGHSCRHCFEYKNGQCRGENRTGFAVLDCMCDKLNQREVNAFCNSAYEEGL